MTTHTSYRKFNFNEFIANVLRDNMDMIIFDLRGCGGCWRPKTSYFGAHFGTLTQHSVHPSVPNWPIHLKVANALTTHHERVSI